MERPQARILAATLLAGALIVVAYVVAVLVTGADLSFGSFALYCLAPFLAVYFLGLVFWRRAGR